MAVEDGATVVETIGLGPHRVNIFKNFELDVDGSVTWFWTECRCGQKSKPRFSDDFRRPNRANKAFEAVKEEAKAHAT